ncbi:MAG: hypothetical protein LBC78_01705 [Oscillospiraceae bacterium]|jgi:hypothetical protein|nr:hypothetical protein [Oscillospiraceae bacterium]
MQSGFNFFSVIARGAILLFVIAGAIVGQMFLSKAKSKLPGLILPALAFVFSIIMALNVPVPYPANFGAAMTVLLALILSNIQTGILLAIYFAVRAKRKRRRGEERMKLQELE